MAKIAESQINRNRRVMADSTIESPYVPVMEDGETDLPERLYDSVPQDKVGFLPTGTKE